MKKFIVRAIVDVPVWIQNETDDSQAIEAVRAMLIVDYGLDIGGELEIVFQEIVPDAIEGTVL